MVLKHFMCLFEFSHHQMLLSFFLLSFDRHAINHHSCACVHTHEKEKEKRNTRATCTEHEPDDQFKANISRLHLWSWSFIFKGRGCACVATQELTYQCENRGGSGCRKTHPPCKSIYLPSKRSSRSEVPHRDLKIKTKRRGVV